MDRKLLLIVLDGVPWRNFRRLFGNLEGWVESGEARVVDLAERLGVTNATVNNTIQRLQRDNLVTAERYRSIFLTDDGRRLAEHSRRRHDLVRDFLIALGVGADVADADAEGIEHHVSEETLKAFRRFLKSH